MGTGTFLKFLVVQPKTFLRLLHHWQTCGTTQNFLKNTAPLVSINFSKYSTQNNLTHITQVKQFKPFEEKKGVCISLEEWALHILQPNKEFQLKVLYVNDPEIAQHWDRVTRKKCFTFKITTEKDFTISRTEQLRKLGNVLCLPRPF
jgi:hypothetical protein